MRGNDLLKYERAREQLSEVREDYPSDSECKRIAEEYLEERGLLSEDAYQSGIADHIDAVGAISVWFGRKTEPYRTWGPGSEILVEVGVDGEIIKVSKRWYTYEPYKMAPIRTPAEAFAQLRNGNALIGAREGIVRIYAIEMHYFTPPQGGYVQPVYNFSFEGGGSGVVPAVRQKYLKSEEQMRREAEQAQAERPRRRRADSEYKP